MGRERTSGPFQFESMQNLIDSIKYHSRPLSESDISLLKIVATCNACKSPFAASPNTISVLKRCREPQLIFDQMGPRWSNRHSLIVVIVVVITTVGAQSTGLRIDCEFGHLSVLISSNTKKFSILSTLKYRPSSCLQWLSHLS